MAKDTVTTRCEECGAVITFPAAQLDTVQDCPKCGALVDVLPEGTQDLDKCHEDPTPKSYDWKKEHQRLWAALVPKEGQADTLQGELIRIVGKLTDEAYRNGNMNWDSECEKMWRFVAKHLCAADTFTAREREMIQDLVECIIADKDDPDVSGDGSTFYLVNEKVVDWCMAHPDPIPHKKDRKLKR
jgi:hypothetical protein